MRRIALLMLAAALLAMHAVQAPAAPPLKQETRNRVLLIGLIPEENIFKQMMKHRPLSEYLKSKTGIELRFTVLSRYPHIVSRFTTRGLDGAFFGAFTGVLAEANLPVEAIVRPVGKGTTGTVKGYLFVRKDSGIRSVEGMKGKRIAFVDQVTATGYLHAIAYFKDLGIRNINSYFREVMYTGSHDTAVYAVLSGKADVGAAKGRIVDALAERDPLVNEELLILHKSSDLPDNTLCLRKDLPLDLKLKIHQTFLHMHEDPEGQEALKEFGAERFVEASWSDFTPVKQMADKAGIDLKNLKYDY